MIKSRTGDNLEVWCHKLAIRTEKICEAIKTDKKLLGYIVVAVSVILIIYGSLIIDYNVGYECANADPSIGKFADFDCYDGCL